MLKRIHRIKAKTLEPNTTNPSNPYLGSNNFLDNEPPNRSNIIVVIQVSKS